VIAKQHAAYPLFREGFPDADFNQAIAVYLDERGIARRDGRKVGPGLAECAT